MRNNEGADKDKQLDDWLRLARPDPALPPRFEEGVWCRIERLELQDDAPGRLAWTERVVAWLLNPRLVAVAALVLLVAGTVAGTVFGTAGANEAAKARYVASVAPQQIR